MSTSLWFEEAAKLLKKSAAQHRARYEADYGAWSAENIETKGNRFPDTGEWELVNECNGLAIILEDKAAAYKGR